MFGIALAAGALLGAAVAFVSVLVGLRSTPAALPTIDSWTGSVNVAAIAAIVGAIAGLLVGAAAWSLAATVLVLVDLRRRSLVVRAVGVAAGSAVGAGLVLWLLASQPGAMIGTGPRALLSLVAGGLAVAALLVSERVGSSRAQPV